MGNLHKLTQPNYIIINVFPKKAPCQMFIMQPSLNDLQFKGRTFRGSYSLEYGLVRSGM